MRQLKISPRRRRRVDRTLRTDRSRDPFDGSSARMTSLPPAGLRRSDRIPSPVKPHLAGDCLRRSVAPAKFSARKPHFATIFSSESSFKWRCQSPRVSLTMTKEPVNGSKHLRSSTSGVRLRTIHPLADWHGGACDWVGPVHDLSSDRHRSISYARSLDKSARGMATYRRRSLDNLTPQG